MNILETIRTYFAIDRSTEAEPEAENAADTLTADDPDTVTPVAVPVTAEEKLEVEPAVREAILDGVLEVFNAALPDFIRSSIDPAAQRAELMARLDGSIASYLDSLNAKALRQAELKLRNAADAARDRSEQYRHQVETLEQQKNKIQEQQLSADRRRRALSERVSDLEAQLSRVEAEREQFQLENQSLLNKLKLADVQPGIIEELNQEIERLRAGVPAEDTSLADGLRKELADKDEEISSLKAEMESASARFADERLKMADELSESRKVLDSVYELQEQMQGVEEVIRKRDEKIARLKSTVKKLKEELAQTREEMSRREDARRPSGLFALAQEPEEEYGDVEPLEDDFQCPDWFVGQPAPGTGNIHAENTDFGYTEPPRKSRVPENDAQLTLF